MHVGDSASASHRYDAQPTCSAPLDFWIKPDPAPDRDRPLATEISATATEYAIALTATSEWTVLVGSPKGINRILARFARERRDVSVFIERLGLGPAEAQPEKPAFPSGRVVNAFFKTEVNNADFEDVLATALVFSVEKRWIQASQVHKWSVEFSRLDETTNDWVPHPSKRIGEDGGTDKLRDCLARLVHSGDNRRGTDSRPTFAVTNLVIQPEQPRVGDEINITATTTNLGASLSVYPSTHWVDNEIERHLLVVA